jgi:hypothetical protein
MWNAICKSLEGTLAAWKQGLKDDKKSKQKSERKVIVMDDNEDYSNYLLVVDSLQ